MRLLAAVLLLSLVCRDAGALEGIVFEAREIAVGGVTLEGASIRLDLPGQQKTRLTVAADAAALPDPVGRLTQIALVCEAPVIAEPRFSCDQGRLTARGGPTGSVDMRLAAAYDTDRGSAQFSGQGLQVAGTTLTLRGSSDATGWRATAETGSTTVEALRSFAKPWFELPADISAEGKVALKGSAAGSGERTELDATLVLDDVNLTNEASTVVTDGMSAAARVQAVLGPGSTGLNLDLDGQRGQVLVGPVLLDFGANPTSLVARGTWKDGRLALPQLQLRQKDLMELAGSGGVSFAGETPRVDADLVLGRLQFPAAYSSYLQITLATTLLGDLRTSGHLHGRIVVRDNAVTRLHVVPQSLELHDNKNRMNLSRVNGDLHWAPADAPDAPRSTLSWASAGAYGLSGGAAELQFHAQGQSFAVTRPTKLPVLDGAITIDTFAVGNLGASNMEVSFKGAIEPISMPRLAKAFGWPEFQGTLAASIPGVTLRDNVLAFQGNVEAQVFGGRIIGSNIRLQDPLGKWPQFFADVRARNLDLDLVTRTFDVGSITGRLEVDVLGLELFAWSPTRFDARLATPKGDKSRHRISAKAVTSLSNVGGGGGGVVQALQGGVLRFFDEYSYEKLGITCRLRNDVCEMSGIEPAGIGYYIVKGAGLPRIDIVGNAGRVRWSQLLESITTTDFGGAATE
jgi:hypothetical protein